MRATLVRALLGVILFLSIDATVFRSNLYWSIAEPSSVAGSLHISAAVVNAIANQAVSETGTKPILVLGDSRVGIGFSTAIADEVAKEAKKPYRFVNGGVPGSTPLKIANYVDQAFDPSGQRFSAVVLMVESVADDEPTIAFGCAYEMTYIHPFVRVLDFPDVVKGCTEPGFLERAVRRIFVDGPEYRHDLPAFLTDIPGRLENVRKTIETGTWWVAHYDGEPKSLDGLSYDPKTGKIMLPSWVPGDLARDLEIYAARVLAPPTLSLPVVNYRRRWIRYLAERHARNGTPLFLIRYARGPLHYLAPREEHPISPFLRRLESESKVRVLLPNILTEMEYPQFYSDRLHPNRPGREIMSRDIARAVLAQLK